MRETNEDHKRRIARAWWHRRSAPWGWTIHGITTWSQRFEQIYDETLEGYMERLKAEKAARRDETETGEPMI